jgi:hypothetical protein
MSPEEMWADVVVETPGNKRLEAVGAKTISKKPNKQRNEVSHSLRRHTEQNELDESNSVGLLLTIQNKHHALRANQHVTGGCAWESSIR